MSGSGAIIGVDLPGKTIKRSNNVIGHHAVVGVKCQDLKYEVSILIMSFHVYDVNFPISSNLDDVNLLVLEDFR